MSKVRKKKRGSKWSKIQTARICIQAAYFAAIAFAVTSMSFRDTVILFSAAFLSGAWYCGWLCPLGTAQELMGRLGRILLKGKRLRLSANVERYLRLLRYCLFVTGIILLFVSVSLTGIVAWISQPYMSFLSIISGQISWLSWLAIAHVGFILLFSLFMDRPFCRYFCVQGAQHGCLSMARVLSIRRNGDSCINCKLCDKVCPVQINISTRGHVRNPQCINCFECIKACPAPGALKYGWVLPKLIKKGVKQ